MKVKAKLSKYIIKRFTDPSSDIFPFLKDEDGTLYMDIISPIHGRSFLLSRKNNFRFVIGKGNGLSYSTHAYLKTSQYDTDTWGALTLTDALRDFEICRQINSFGIKTNKAEYVLELPFEVIFRGTCDKAALFQYSVECPYRISDFAFIPPDVLKNALSTWNKDGEDQPKHLLAANILFRNLRILHNNGILHNAINIQNYTWALELVDFEASHTPQIPYGSKEYQSFIPMMSEMEILQTYEIVNYIAWCLGETPNYIEIQKILKEWGFRLNHLQI